MIFTKIKNYIKEKTEHNGFKRYLANTSWLFLGKIFTLILSFFLFSYVARYLGPKNLGNLSYAQSFVSLFAIFSSFGIDHVLYRELVRHKEKRQELLGSAILMKTVLGLITFIITVGISLYTENECLIVLLIGIIAITNIFQPFTSASLYFDTIQKSKINTMGMILINIILSILKIGIIIFNKGIIYFAFIFVLETVFNAIYYLIIYSYYCESITKWRAHFTTIKSLMRESLPLLLASVSAVIYARIDQVMIKHYLDASSVGLYSVAVRIAEVWNFIPSLIISSVFPAIINAKITNEIVYEKRFAKLFTTTLGISILFAFSISMFSNPIIKIVAGNQYIAASQVLIIYIWGVVGMIVTNVAQQLLVAERWTKITFYMTMVGAVINTLLNLWLIPRLGITGAAFSTLIAYWTVPFSLFLFKNTRKKIWLILTSHFKTV